MSNLKQVISMLHIKHEQIQSINVRGIKIDRCNKQEPLMLLQEQALVHAKEIYKVKHTLCLFTWYFLVCVYPWNTKFNTIYVNMIT